MAIFAAFLLAIRFLPDFARNLTLLLVSIAWIEIATSPFYAFLFVAFTGVLYYALFWLQWSPKKKTATRLIALFLVVFYFLLQNEVFFHSAWTGSMVHRFGIAYSLFRLLAVTLDVGNGKPLPTDPLEFFVFAFFLPPFFQGPIERLDEFRKNLGPERPPLHGKEMLAQVIRIACALAKGWVVARYLELDWKTYFDYPQHLSYGTLVWGLYARAIGFYLFVSAANDLTIASCTLAGYPLHENFDYPYFKRNLALFWRSWHMTLVRFLRDYIYLPLGGNRQRVYLNYLVVFLAIAMWHVVSPAFLIWGLWHGLGMCFLRLWQSWWAKIETREGGALHRLQAWSRSHPKLTHAASVLATFHFVAFGWLPFWGGHPQGVSMMLRILSGNHWKLFEWIPS
jgi:D-alanyl-lipoteichoic acid acyltransferase DltB (MBOAT superfamily)